tara:strand:+ start:4250 stop:4840 length:591 start_codon:yes stop_codon:yes gene_type:complete
MSSVLTADIQEFNPKFHLTNEDCEKRLDAFHKVIYKPGEVFYWPKNFSRHNLYAFQNRIPIPKPKDRPLLILSVFERNSYDSSYIPEELTEHLEDYFRRNGWDDPGIPFMHKFEGMGCLFANLPVLWIKVQHPDGNHYWIMKQNGNGDLYGGEIACDWHPQATWSLGGLYDLPSPTPKSSKFWIEELRRTVPNQKE